MNQPPRNLRIGAVSFLNTVPLIEGLDRRPGIDLQRDLPARLADLLFDGQIDVGLIPVVEYLRGVGTELAAGVCIASRGPVGTVKVFSQVPLEEATSIAVDRGSRSSVALLRVLLAEIHDRHPDLHVVEPRPENLFHQHATALVIGDRAEQISGDGLHVYDLGEMWREFTGLPFVFAAWALGPHLAPLEFDERRRALVRELGAARDRGMERLPELAEREAAARGAAAADIVHYWTHNIHYRLGEEELEGLRHFADLAARHDLIPRRREVAVAEA
jgi:chorismate dehydratase